MLLALTEGWSDAVAITGLVVTVAGFAITLIQLRKTKSAADAAREAADRAYNEGRRHLQTLVAANAHRFVAEVREAVERRDWLTGARRVNDLADQLVLSPQVDTELTQMVDQLRSWGGHFARLASGELRRFRSSRWSDFLRQAQRKIDTLRLSLPDLPGSRV